MFVSFESEENPSFKGNTVGLFYEHIIVNCLAVDFHLPLKLKLQTTSDRPRSEQKKEKTWIATVDGRTPAITTWDV